MVLRSTQPSSWWVVVIAAAALISSASGIGAYAYQHHATRLIGEGEVLVEDGREGLREVDEATSLGLPPDQAVRRLRNHLENEGVALIDDSGRVTASSSPNLIGDDLNHSLLLRALSEDRFGAVAAPIDHDLLLDGIPEWQEGDVLYMSLLPGDGHNLLLFYDLTELMGRRIRGEGIQPETIQLAAVSVFCVVAALLTLAGRSRAVRRYREMNLEAEYLQKESEALQAHNAELEIARAKAERALALAEENNRIRSEFVLMINHELRTPLTSVVTGAELLRASRALDSEERHILESLVHDGRRLQGMIDQLLTLARVENRGLAFTPQAIGMADACRVATESHNRLGHCDGIHHDPVDDRAVMTDVQTLTLLVASLVDNAYTHGASTVQVGCAARVVGTPQLVIGTTPHRAASLSVIDDGPGIRPEFLPRAFEKFEKDSRSAGTGLGLYMARLMTEAIGAALHVWTSPEGTTISIVMPLAHVTTKVGAA